MRVRHSQRNMRASTRQKAARSQNRRGYDWRPGPSAEWARLIPGAYGLCEECGGLVDVTTSGTYKCSNTLYDENMKKVGTCGHQGEIPTEEADQVATNYNAYVPGGGRGNGAIVQCNCWEGRLHKPCHVCYYADKDTLPEDEKHHATDNSARTHYAMTVVRLGYFHDIEKVSKRNTKYTVREKCIGKKKCPHCRDDIERTRGKLEWWNPGWGHWNDLLGWGQVVGQKCLNCEDGKIAVLGYECASCAEILLDVNETELEDKEILQFAAKPQVCSECDTRDVPVPMITCYTGDPEEPDAGCDHPEQTTLFDVDIKLRNDNSSIQVVEHTAPKTLDEQFVPIAIPFTFASELGEIDPKKQAEEMRKPYAYGKGRPAGGGAKTSGSVQYKDDDDGN